MKNKISYKANSQIVIRDNKKYLKKIKKSNKEELFNYLQNKGFTNFLPYVEETNNYELYPYIDELKYPKEDKAVELIQTIALLHTLTTTYQDIDLNEIKELYEQTSNYLEELRYYYLDLQDYIETKEFFSPAEQLLMNNISNIYKAINYSNYKLNEWYKLIEKKTTIRQVQLHNNLSLEHILKDKIPYLINWDKSKKGLVIYDFINFYKNDFQNIEMSSLFKIYQSKYQYTEEEQLLFESLLTIPPKTLLNKTNYINTLEVRKMINYIEKTNTFLLKDNEEN